MSRKGQRRTAARSLVTRRPRIGSSDTAGAGVLGGQQGVAHKTGRQGCRPPTHLLRGEPPGTAGRHPPDPPTSSGVPDHPDSQVEDRKLCDLVPDREEATGPSPPPELAAPREDCIQGLLLFYPSVSLPGVHRRTQGEEGGLPKPADVWAGLSCPWCLTAAEMGWGRGRPAAAASRIQAGLESRKPAPRWSS